MDIPIIGGNPAGVVDLGKRPFFCPGCKGDVFLMSQAIHPWYRLEKGEVTFGGTSLGMGYVCIKCRRVMLMDSVIDMIGKELKATGGTEKSEPGNGSTGKRG